MYSKIVELLEERGQTVAELCRATEINQSVFANLKNRDTNLSAGNPAKVAKYFGLPMEYFMEG